MTITANGNVTGTNGDGIYANSAGPIAITVGATSTVTSANASPRAIEGPSVADNPRPSRWSPLPLLPRGLWSTAVPVAPSVFDPMASSFANRLELVTGAVINGNVLGGTGTDTLGLSGTGSGSFNVGQLSSFEAGQKTGSGTWTLTGANAGITAFSVGAGTLAVNGSLGNAAFTVSSGTLSGIGTVGNTSIAGGIFQPGSGTPGSFMTVNGTLGFNAASTFAVNVNPTTSSFANVSGAATLGGATVNAIFAPGSYIQKQYTILNAGTVNGTFGTLTNTNLPSNFSDTLSYDATHAYLNLILGLLRQPAPGGLCTGNWRAAANAADRPFQHHRRHPDRLREPECERFVAGLRPARRVDRADRHHRDRAVHQRDLRRRVR